MTFHFVTFAWVFFRAPNLQRAFEILGAPIYGRWAHAGDVLSANAFVIVLLLIFLASHRFDDHRHVRIAARSLPREVFWPIILALWIVAITVSQGSSSKFIYFDF